MKKFPYFAANTSCAKRIFNEGERDDIRDEYQIDRDRVLYSKAFRRLRGKTQVFIAGYDDHVRNRLSHTLEVCQIARTISKALGLNEMLTEAIALGHDLGHTPFGHVGERLLHDISCGDKILVEKGFCHEKASHGFKHNWQSVRVACNLEYHNRDFPGLNLTKETLWGFLHHSGLSYSGVDVPFYKTIYGDLLPDHDCWSFEGIVVNLADEIAQRHHDIEDGLITEILDRKSLIKCLEDTYDKVPGQNAGNLKRLWQKARDEIYPEFYFETLARGIVNFYVSETVENTEKIFNTIAEKYLTGDDKAKIFYEKKGEIWSDFVRNEKAFVRAMMSESLYNADSELQSNYFKKRILLSHQAQKNDGKAQYVIRKIVEAYLTNPQQMPDNAIIMLFVNCEAANKYDKQLESMNKVLSKEQERPENIGLWRQRLEQLYKDNDCALKKALVRTVIDYVAGMTDDYAIAVYEQLYGGIKQNRY